MIILLAAQAPRMTLPVMAVTRDPHIVEALGCIVAHPLFGYGSGVLQVTDVACADMRYLVRLEVADLVGDYGRTRNPVGRRETIMQPWQKCDVSDLELIEAED